MQHKCFALKFAAKGHDTEMWFYVFYDTAYLTKLKIHSDNCGSTKNLTKRYLTLFDIIKLADSFLKSLTCMST